MKIDEWLPIYEEIRRDIGLNREKDEEAAKLLDGLIEEEGVLADMRDVLIESNVVVGGDADSLLDDLSSVGDDNGVIVAADGAAVRLMDSGVDPVIQCTDLDGSPEGSIELSHRGCISIVHGHGDNLEAIREFVPRMNQDMVIGSTQVEPVGSVHNFGGFTDGDRCVYLADEFGADSIELIGFDFFDESVSESKKVKLQWAYRLIRLMEERRGEDLLH